MSDDETKGPKETKKSDGKKSRTKDQRKKQDTEVEGVDRPSSADKPYVELLDPELDTIYSGLSYFSIEADHEAFGLAAASMYRWLRDVQGLDSEILSLRKKVAEQAGEIERGNEGKANLERDLSELKKNVSQLREKEQLRHLLDRVGKPARAALLKGGRLRDLFQHHETCNAYVMSIDVRRSTDLMLKARKPGLFARFITELAKDLRGVILGNFGVFDKFTGDGILCFFPTFYSGSLAGLRAVDAARECHEVFAKLYRQHRRSFMAVLKDTGLGIGIDYGEVNVVQMHGEFTVVGTPVVYACRLGGADAGQTLVNQPAYEGLLESFSEFLDFRETEKSFKHEGTMVAYSVCRNEKASLSEDPEWVGQANEH